MSSYKRRAFAETIEENIAFGRRFSKEQIEEAAARAQAKEFINQLPKRLAHPLHAKGSNLSGVKSSGSCYRGPWRGSRDFDFG